MAADPKKPFPNESYKNSKYTVINWWNKQHIKNKLLFLIILSLGIIAVTSLSGLLESKNAQEISAINQMKTALETAQPIIIDFHDSLSAYNSGSMDSNTAIGRLQVDKATVDGLISKMQSKKPPYELQQPYSVTLSALQDLSTSIGSGVDGIKNNNFPEIDQGINAKDDLTTKFNEANNEVSKLPYPTS